MTKPKRPSAGRVGDLTPRAMLVRRRESDRRFAALQRKVTRAVDGKVLGRVCIYATGSYGRGESSSGSDIDLFMVDAADALQGRLGNIGQIVLKAQLVSICRKQRLPEFSGDGEHLAVHWLSDMLGILGHRQDDAINAFTARLLLLLESRCLFNRRVYDSVIKSSVGEYFRDYEGKESRFLPAFLINDIVRYWKTVCLNYEHSRGKRRSELARNADLRREYKLKNLKLKFSRVMTCYSAVAMLAWIHRKGTVRPEDVMRMVRLSPTERIARLGEAKASLREPARRVLAEYAWFLETLSSDKASSIRRLGRRANAKIADRHARLYRDSFLELLEAAGRGGELLRYVWM